MDLGLFSIGLAVKDLQASLGFYKALGFQIATGDPAQHWVVLENGAARIGLFEGMFEANVITFNPTDARAIQRALLAAGHEPDQRADEGEGPTHFVTQDPDGNAILVDQHA